MNNQDIDYLELIRNTIGKDKDLTIEDLKEFVSKYYHCNQFFNSFREMASILGYPPKRDDFNDVFNYTDGAINDNKPYVCFVISGKEFYPDGIGSVKTEYFVQYNSKGFITSIWAFNTLVLNGRVFFYFISDKSKPQH